MWRISSLQEHPFPEKNPIINKHSSNMQRNHNTKRIASNTIVLYFRMLFTMFIGLFTSRIILQSLGVEDYGIYNVVGGVTTMFIFINSSMSVASSRFIAFAIGKQDIEYERKVFRHILYIHYFIALIVALLIETVGLWFLYEKLVIPAERIGAAFWVLQFSAVTCFLNVISTPYNAMIIGHERLSSFAYISILESCLKLGICYLVLYTATDKLILYAFLLMCIGVLIRMIYAAYARKTFEATHGKIAIDKGMIKEISSFAGWNALGNVALMTIDQGMNIVLNIFFGPVVNASRGVALQVNNVIVGFSNNIRMAINPQITKSYSCGDIKYMHELIRISSVYSFFLILVCFIPIWQVSESLLSLWLVEVPAYALPFLRLSLLYALVNSFANPIIIGVHATGVIRKFQIVEGGLMLSSLPLAYLFLKLGFSPNSAYYAMILVAFIAQIGRLYVALPLLHMSTRYYMFRILFPCLKATLLCSVVLCLSNMLYKIYPVVAFILCSILTCLVIFFVGLNSDERNKIVNFSIHKLRSR